jgi:ABC-type transport system involved in multi-copper enzyme maturation permease subunit
MRARRHNAMRNIRILLRREFIMVIENFRLQGLIIFLTFLMTYLNAFENGSYNKWFFDLPYFFIPIILVVTSSNLISRERETGMLDLLRLSRITKNEFMVSKVIFGIFIYLIFAAVFLIDVALFAWEIGDYFLIVNVIGIFGMYLLIFILFMMLLLIISALSARDVYSVGIGMFFLFYVVFIHMFLLAPTPYYKYTILNKILIDLDKIYHGNYPDPTIWGGLFIATILAMIVYYFVIGRLWRGLKE